MELTLRAKFDGKVFVPDEPVELPAGQIVNLRIVEDVEEVNTESFKKLVLQCR